VRCPPHTAARALDMSGSSRAARGCSAHPSPIRWPFRSIRARGSRFPDAARSRPGMLTASPRGARCSRELGGPPSARAHVIQGCHCCIDHNQGELHHSDGAQSGRLLPAIGQPWARSQDRGGLSAGSSRRRYADTGPNRQRARGSIRRRRSICNVAGPLRLPGLAESTACS